jgi:hypothetical protein
MAYYFPEALDQVRVVGLTVMMAWMCIEGLIGAGFSTAEDFRVVRLRSGHPYPSLAADEEVGQDKGLRRATREGKQATAPSTMELSLLDISPRMP